MMIWTGFTEKLYGQIILWTICVINENRGRNIVTDIGGSWTGTPTLEGVPICYLANSPLKPDEIEKMDPHLPQTHPFCKIYH